MRCARVGRQSCNAHVDPRARTFPRDRRITIFSKPGCEGSLGFGGVSVSQAWRRHSAKLASTTRPHNEARVPASASVHGTKSTVRLRRDVAERLKARVASTGTVFKNIDRRSTAGGDRAFANERIPWSGRGFHELPQDATSIHTDEVIQHRRMSPTTITGAMRKTSR